MTDRANLFNPEIIQQNAAPWEPDDVKLPQIGDRVRVNFSAECEFISAIDSPAGRSAISRGHAADINAQGKSGTIIELEIGDEDISSQHHYLVRLGEPFEFNDRYFRNTAAAAIELTPIEADEVVT